MTLPVRVAGSDTHKGQWSEIAETLNVSSGGLAMRLSKRVMIGDTLHLEVTLPARLLKNPNSSPTYNISARVRYIEIRGSSEQIVRVQFLGEFTLIH
jgi:hypothetical protein